MLVRTVLAGVAALAICCTLMLVGGCGAEPAPAPAMGSGSMADMHHDPAPATAPATAPAPAPATAPMMAAKMPTMAYMCAHCGTVAEKAGECPMCHMAMKETPVSNPDPSICPVTGETIEKPHLVVADGKVYDCCDTDCMDELKKDPAGCMKKAQERADAAKKTN